MTIDTNELRMLAEDLYVNGYNRYSAAMSNAADELTKWEAVFGHLGSTPDDCGNAIIAARDELEERLKDAEAEALEEARLNGMGAERELVLMAKLEASEKERDPLCADKATLQQMTYSLKDRLEVAEKDVALKEKLIDALGSTLNAVFNERDALRTVLTDLLNDLEERAKWNLEESQRVVACGNGVYMRAKTALEESK